MFMDWFGIFLLVLVYAIQVLVVFRELVEGEYTRKYRVICDLIPFSFLILLLINIFIFLYEIFFERLLDEFKKLK